VSPPSSRRVVVTAGPTREYVDPIRYLSNRSSGKMGFEIAKAAQRRGDEVVLVVGPVSLATPAGIERIDVVSAREMLAEVRRAFRDADALFMCAAVADWRPRRKLAGKWRKKDEGSEVASLELVRNPDILATVGRQKGSRLVVGFALETARGTTRARAKLHRKKADYIVLNDETALRADRTTVTILGRDGSARRMEDRSKRAVAEVLVDLRSLPSVPRRGNPPA
jgi:phosphopantothenoylcysteine decarboxylase / phosphopantothenate---cysteine ligase